MVEFALVSVVVVVVVASAGEGDWWIDFKNSKIFQKVRKCHKGRK